ncbi:MAG TPA: BrnT family toxin [Rhodanobacteraceae bacterium]
MHFEWDAEKAAANLAKHGVAFEEALTCFFDPEQIAFHDPDHSDAEHRELLIGHSNRGHLLIVSYTLRRQTARLHLRPQGHAPGGKNLCARNMI